jgi:Family of unknown function (DUF6496)
MPDSKAKTKAGKQRFVAKAMGEFKQGEMKSGSGQKVTDPKQAIAIALNQTGQSKPPAQRKGSSRISSEISRRVDAGQQRARG